MNRVDYLQARLRQLRASNLLPRAFSNWLARLEQGDALPIQPVYSQTKAPAALLAKIQQELKRP